MKKVIFSVICLVALALPAVAGSIVYNRGDVWKPAAQTSTTLATLEQDIWTTSTTYNVPQYTNRVFSVYNPASGATINATIEASIDGTRWATVDGSSLTAITTGKTSMAKVLQHCAPYWRVRACFAGGVYAMSSPETRAVMSSN